METRTAIWTKQARRDASPDRVRYRAKCGWCKRGKLGTLVRLASPEDPAFGLFHRLGYRHRPDNDWELGRRHDTFAQNEDGKVEMPLLPAIVRCDQGGCHRRNDVAPPADAATVLEPDLDFWGE